MILNAGGAYWVYPGASHTRFEHSIGTSYLCGRMLTTLRELHRDVYKDGIDKLITDKDIICIKIAGLCHDLGHGPFSHAFDMRVLKEVRPELHWKHEDASCDLFDYIIESNGELKEMLESIGLGAEERHKIKTTIRGKNKNQISDNTSDYAVYQGVSYKKQFLYEIVANASTGIDCDKFDYIARDTHHIGMKNSFNFERYFNNVRIMPVDNQLRICARDKEEANLYELFHTRWTLHRLVYQHKTAILVEEMVARALIKADERFGISSSLDDMERYTDLTDSIVNEIIRTKDESDTNLEEAKRIFRAIQTRNLYTYCGRINPRVMVDEDSDELSWSQQKLHKYELTEGLIKNCQMGDINHEDIFVNRTYFSFGKNDSNPLEQMVFFGKDGQLRRRQISDFTGNMPKCFEEECFMVYCTNSEKTLTVKNAFVKWCKENGYRNEAGSV